mgnify:CR=1 FL=1
MVSNENEKDGADDTGDDSGDGVVGEEGRRPRRHKTRFAVSKTRSAVGLMLFCFCSYIRHTRPDPVTKRISVVPNYDWRDVSHICLPIYLLKLSS